MASKKIITVFGATGKQGGSIVRTFLNDPKLKDAWAVRGVSRSVEGDGAKKLSAQGVEVVAVSSRPPSSLLPTHMVTLPRKTSTESFPIGS